MRALNAETAKNGLRLSKRTTGRVETDGEHPDGRRRLLSLPRFIKFRCVALAERVCDSLQTNSTTCSFLKLA